MVIFLISGIVLFYLVSVWVFGRAVHVAEEGYEDEAGFHQGRPTDTIALTPAAVRGASRWDLGPSGSRWVESPTAVAQELVLHH